jgi:hypothetical protein
MAIEPGSVVPDPFLDEDFAPLDMRGDGGNLVDQLNAMVDEDNPPPPADPAPPAPVAEPPAPPAKDDDNQPRVYEYEDGASVTIEKGSRGWKATLDSNTGAPAEIFYGGTKEELLTNLAAGKMNATRKIRQLNKQMKLENVSTPAPAAPAPIIAEGRVLTADEIFQIKAELTTNPDSALSKWFLARTGMSLEDLVRLAKVGKSASDELSAEAVSKAFLGSHEDYIPYENNFKAIVMWLAKYKLQQALNGRDPSEMVEVLFNAGKWTVENLDAAYEDLKADGLLDLKVEPPPADPVEPVPAEPAPPKAAEPVPPPAEPPTPATGRIVREIRRPRAGLGIRQSATTAGPSPDPVKPPSAEELDALSDDAIEQLLRGVRQTRMGTRR